MRNNESLLQALLVVALIDLFWIGLALLIFTAWLGFSWQLVLGVYFGAIFLRVMFR